MKGFKKYGAYKKSGVEWIGEIPEEWKLIRLGRLGRFSKGNGISKADIVPNGLPAILYGDIYTKYEIKADVLKNSISEKTAKKSVSIKKGDLLFTGSGESKEDIGKCIIYEGKAKAYAGGDIIIFRQKKCDGLFLSYLLNSDFVIYQKTISSKGHIIIHTYASKLKELILPLPPLPEQTTISRFLDAKTAQIDAYIRLKEKTIALLEERKAALVNQAVTRGLDPTVKMKDSGVEWLGEVPEGWEVKKLKYVSNLQSGIAIGPKNITTATGGYPYLRVANVQDGYLKLSVVKRIALDKKRVKRYLLKKGDLLMNEGGDYDKLGRGYVWNCEIEPCLHQNHVYAIRMKKNVNPYWVNYTTLTYYAKEYFKSKSKQTTNLASISTRNINEYPVVFPPIEEQNKIMEYLKRKGGKIDASINTNKTQITLIKEYRQGLISAAVTGKVDVRGWGEG